MIFDELARRLESVELASPVERMRSSFLGGVKRMRIRYPAAPGSTIPTPALGKRVLQRVDRLPLLLASAVILGCGLLLRPAAAENLLANPSFPQALGVTSWKLGQGTAAWNTFECGFTAPTSGSAHLDSALLDNRARIEQCVAVDAGTRYRLAASVYLDQGVKAAAALVFHEITCGTDAAPGGLAEVSTMESGNWVDLELSHVAPPGTVAATVDLSVDNTGFYAQAFFDDIELPEPAESGTYTALLMLVELTRRRAVAARRIGQGDRE